MHRSSPLVLLLLSCCNDNITVRERLHCEPTPSVRAARIEFLKACTSGEKDNSALYECELIAERQHPSTQCTTELHYYWLRKWLPCSDPLNDRIAAACKEYEP